jgi:hypothetical protein
MLILITDNEYLGVGMALPLVIIVMVHATYYYYKNYHENNTTIKKKIFTEGMPEIHVGYKNPFT